MGVSLTRLLTLVLVFLLGALSSQFYASLDSSQGEQSIDGNLQIPRPGVQQFAGLGYPQDRVPEEDILVYSDRVVLDVKNAQWAKFTDTKSMEPTFGAASNAIEFVPESAADLDVGDIASYRSTIDGGIIIHRIVYKGEDDEGTYFIFKGDNNPSSDPEKVRFSQIQRVVAAIIY